MKRPTEWLPVAGWGLAVAGAFVVYVSGGCALITKVQDRMERGRIKQEAAREAHRQPVYPGPEVRLFETLPTTPVPPVPDVGPSPVPPPRTP